MTEIKIKEGRRPWVRLTMGEWQRIVAFSRTDDGCDGQPRIEVCQQTIKDHYEAVGTIQLELDPVAAAVAKERERCKAVLIAELDKLDIVNRPCCCSDNFRTPLLAALDAEPVEPSEYERGGEAMRERIQCCVPNWPISEEAKGITRRILDAVPGVREPPDA